MRPMRAALIGCALSGCSAGAALPDAPSGLTCTAGNGAIIRLNVDPVAGTFQKERFPVLPIAEVNDRTIVLMRNRMSTISVEASLDRRTLVYTARSEDSRTRTKTRMDYRCVADVPFNVIGAR